jgi:hypothetical protein
MLTVHSQVTLLARWCRKTVTTCRQAAVQSAGDARVHPYGYQLPLASGAKLKMTGLPDCRTALAYERRYASYLPAVIEARDRGSRPAEGRAGTPKEGSPTRDPQGSPI